MDSVQINSSGNFVFNNVTKDTVTVYAKSNTLNTIGTYYGDTCAWIPGDSGIVICDTNYINIVLDEVLPMTGSGSISGVVVQGYHYGKLTTLGSPIGGVDVGIRKKPQGNIVAMTQTNSLGMYSIGNITPGNYNVYVDIPGLPMDSTYDFSITTNDSVAQLDFIADSASVYIVGAVGISVNHDNDNPALLLLKYFLNQS